MPSIEVNDYVQDLAANGDSTGYAQVADSSGFYVGCLGFIRNDDGAQRVIFVEIKDSTHVRVRIIADDMEQQAALQIYGGHSDLTAYTTAKHSRLYMERQLARIEPAFVKPNAKNI